MAEKKQNHHRHREHHLDEGGLEVVDGASDQVRPVVHGEDLDASWKARLDFPDFGLHALDHIQRVLTLPHDDNSGHHLPSAVEVADAPAEVGAHRDLTDVTDTDRGPVFPGRYGDVLDVLDGLRIPASTDHVFRTAEFDQAAPGVAVAGTHRLHHPGEREVIGLQPVRVHGDLVLLSEPTDGSHFGHARNRFQVIAQGPVLVRA